MSHRGTNPKNDQLGIDLLFEAKPPHYKDCPESDQLRKAWKNEYDTLQDANKKVHDAIFRELLKFFKTQGSDTYLIDKAMTLEKFLEHQLKRCIDASLKDASQLLRTSISCISRLTRSQTVSVDNDDPQPWQPTNVVFSDVLRRADEYTAELRASKENAGRLGSHIWQPEEYLSFLDTGSTLGARGIDARRGAHMTAEISLALTGGLRSQDLRDCKYHFGTDSFGGVEILVVSLSRASSKVSSSGHSQHIPVVPHQMPHLDAIGILAEHILISFEALAFQQQPNVCQKITAGDSSWYDDVLFTDDVFSNDPVEYSKQLSMYAKVISATQGEADMDKDAKLHMAKNTSNSILLRAGVPEVERKAWGWKTGGVQKVSYDSKDPLATIGCAAVLGGHGDWGGWRDHLQSYNWRGAALIPEGFLDKWVDKLMPGLQAATQHINTCLGNIKEMHPKGLTDKRRRELGVPLMKAARDTCKGLKLMFTCWLCNLPFKLKRFGDEYGVLRRVAAVGGLIDDPEWPALSALLLSAHKKCLDDLAYNHMSPRERDAFIARQHAETQARQMHQMFEMLKSEAMGAPALDPLPVPEPVPSVITVQLESPKKKEKIQGDPVKLQIVPTVLGSYQAFFGEGGQLFQFEEKKRQNKSAKDAHFSKYKHLPLRVQECISQGMPLEQACGIYERVKTELGLTMAELRDCVMISEPVRDPKARGGRPSAILGLNGKPSVTVEMCKASIIKHKGWLGGKA